jgi:F-type H+-transporting ATPase subunit b
MELYPQDIVIHIINILVLYVVLRALVYNPVRKFMLDRTQRIQKELDDAKTAKEEAESKRLEYDKIISDAETEARNRISESDVQAAKSAQNIIDEANEKAREIISDAKSTVETERRRMLENMRDDVADAAVDIAEHLLQKEVNVDDNKKLAKQFFEVYKNAEGRSV